MSLDAFRSEKSAAMEAVRSSDALLAMPVRLHGVQLGQPVDLVLDAESLRAVGFEVRCGDEIARFLPFAAGRVGGDEISVDSALLLLEGSNLSFYRNRTLSLRSLRGRAVDRRGHPLGTLREVAVAPDGTVVELALETPNGPQRVPLEPGVRIGDAGAASAA